MAVYLPCLSVDKPDDGSGFSVGVGAGLGSGGDGDLTPGVGITITHSDSPISLGISPLPPFIFLGPNLAFWKSLFGLGETRIDRQKEAIQDVYTSIFQYLKQSYGVPIADNHALQFPADGVQKQFARRPDIAALVPYLSAWSEQVAEKVFADNSVGSGKRERVVNQFLANAAYNNWPVSATVQIWDGIVSASQDGCSADAKRWMQNPMVVQSAAQMAVILQYIPLPVLVNMAASHAIGDPLAENLLQAWAANPQLVAGIPHRDQYPWQSIYTSGMWRLPPYGTPLGGAIPLVERDHIKPLLAGISFQRPLYPDFLQQSPSGVPVPQQPSPVPPPQSVPPIQPQPDPTPVPQPPYPDPVPQTPPPVIPGQVVNIPPAQHQGEPSQQDLDYACTVWKWIRAGVHYGLSTDVWMLTQAGRDAMSAQQNNPACQCGPVPQQPNVVEIPPQQPNPQGPQDPECPPFPQPQPQPQPPAYPEPGQQPNPQGPQQPCPPACQDEINQLRAKVIDCCDRQTFGVIPRIENLETWVLDLERRVPGPIPSLPNPDPYAPFIPPLPVDPPDDPDNNGTPGANEPGLIPPDVIDCLSVYCDGEVHPPPDDPKEHLGWALRILCECGRNVAGKAKKLVLDACQFGQLAWGLMAECWLNANTDAPGGGIPVPPILQSWVNISNDMDAAIYQTGPSFLLDCASYGIDKIDATLYGQPDPVVWPFPQVDTPVPFIFADPSQDTRVELPVTEKTL